MRIALALHASPARSTAGVEVYTLRLGKALQALGHDVLVLAAAHDLAVPEGTVRRRRHGGLEVAEIVSVPRPGLESTYRDHGVGQAAASVLSAFAPECVHVQHLQNLASSIVDDARALGAAVVMTLHDYWFSCPRDGLRMREDLELCPRVDAAVCASCLRSDPRLPSGLEHGLLAFGRRAGLGRALHRLHDAFPRTSERALGLARRRRRPAAGLAAAIEARTEHLRRTLSRVDLVLAPTRFMAARALEFGFPPASVRVSALGAVHSPMLARPPRRRLRIGFVGTVAPAKGVHVLVEAMTGLRQPEATLTIHGGQTVFPGYAADLHRAAEGDARIRFAGPFREGEQERILSDLDVLVVPSVWWENSPLVVLEALAAGVPVIASTIGGLPELIPPGAGLLVPAGDVVALRDVLEEVVAGRVLAGSMPPLVLKTVEEGARELSDLYREVRERAA